MEALDILCEYVYKRENLDDFCKLFSIEKEELKQMLSLLKIAKLVQEENSHIKATEKMILFLDLP